MRYEFEKLRVTLMSRGERMRTFFFFFLVRYTHLLAEMWYFFWYGRNDPVWLVFKPERNNHVSVLTKVSER